MATGDGERTSGALHRLRQRWFSPSPPLAVDDVPHWRPPADPGGEQSDGEADSEGPRSSPAVR